MQVSGKRWTNARIPTGRCDFGLFDTSGSCRRTHFRFCERDRSRAGLSNVEVVGHSFSFAFVTRLMVVPCCSCAQAGMDTVGVTGNVELAKWTAGSPVGQPAAVAASSSSLTSGDPVMNPGHTVGHEDVAINTSPADWWSEIAFVDVSRPTFGQIHQTHGHRALTDEQEWRFIDAIDALQKARETADSKRCSELLHTLFPTNNASFDRNFVVALLHRRHRALKTALKWSAPIPATSQRTATSMQTVLTVSARRRDSD